MTVRANRGFTFIDDAWTAAEPPVIKLPGRSRISSIPGHPTPDGTGLKHLRLALILLLPLLLVISGTAPLQAGLDDSPKFKGDIPIAAGPLAEPARPQLPAAIQGTEEEKWALPIFQELFYSGSQNFICGRLTGPDGLPASHIAVLLYDWNDGYTFYPVRVTSTDEDGFYFFTNIRAGWYRLFFSTLYVNSVLGQNLASTFYSTTLACSPNWGDDLSIGNDQIITGLDMQMQPGLTLTGRVTSKHGEPLAGISVSICFNVMDYRNTLTGADGSYRLEHLPTGRGSVTFWDPAGKYARLELYDSVDVSGENPVLDMQMEIESCIEGRVTDTAGEGIEGIKVTLYPAPSGAMNEFWTEADGRYRTSPLKPGKYRVHFKQELAGCTFQGYYHGMVNGDEAVEVEVPPGTEVNGIDYTITYTGRIKGRLLIGISGLVIRFYNSSGEEACHIDSPGYEPFTTTELPIGEYTIYFDASRNPAALSTWYLNKPSMELADSVTVKTCETTELGNIDVKNLAFGFISGRVTDQDGQGLNGISVYLPEYWIYATTGTQGDYLIGPVPAGSYRVQYLPPAGLNLQQQWYPDKLKASDGVYVTVSAGQTTTGIDTRMQQGGCLDGRVTDYFGNALENIDVTVHPVDEQLPRHQTKTDASGYYSFCGLSTASYRLQYNAEQPYLSTWYNRKTQSQADVVMVQTRQTVKNVNVWLDRYGMVAGRVTNSAGLPLAGISIWFYMKSPSSEYYYKTKTASSDSNGNFSIMLFPADYKVRFVENPSNAYAPEWYPGCARIQDAQKLSLQINQILNGIDAKMLAGGAIEGKLAFNQNSIACPVEVAISFNGEQLGYQNITPPANYRFSCLYPGNYKVHVSSKKIVPVWFREQENESAAQSVPVRSGITTSGIDFLNLRETGVLGGAIFDQAHAPVSGQTVILYDSQFKTYSSIQTYIDGSFYFSKLIPGTYYLKVSGGNGYLEQWYSGKTSSASATPIMLKLGEPMRNLVIIMQEQGRITGQVTTSWNQPVKGASVRAYHQESGNWYGTETDFNGYYQIRALPSGNYKVSFYSYEYQTKTQWFNGKADEASANLVKVLPNMTTSGVNAKLLMQGMIVGHVKNSQGEPIRSVELYLYKADGYLYSSCYSNWFDGFFIFANLPDGDYKLYVEEIWDYRAQWWQNAESFQDAKAIRAAANQTASPIVIEMNPAPRISGTVTDESGNPVNGVTVTVKKELDSTAGSSKTDANGKFLVKLNYTGDMKVSFSHAEYCQEYYQDQWTFEDATPLRIESSSSLENVDAVLAKRGSLQGRLLNPAGEPCPDLCVYLYSNNDRSWIKNHTTLADGVFIFSGLDQGDYWMWVRGSDAPEYLDTWYPGVIDSAQTQTIRLLPGENREGADINVQSYYPPEVPLLSGPPFALSGRSYQLSWSNICPDGWYHVRVAETPSFENPEPFVAESNRFWGFHQTDTIKPYYYQVRSVRSYYGYSYSPWSAAVSVTVFPTTSTEADLNQDQLLDGQDLLLLAQGLAGSFDLAGRGDIDKNGQVDLFDLQKLTLILTGWPAPGDTGLNKPPAPAKTSR